MKKIFLTLAVVLGTTTMINANSNVATAELAAKPSCFDTADVAADLIGDLFGLSYEAEHEMFLVIYDACVEQNR